MIFKNHERQRKRVIAVAFTSNTLENFKPVFEYEIETRRLEDGSFTCTTTSKTGSVESLLKNRYVWEDDDNEDTFSLARDVSDQLSIIVNAFDKDNAQEIIVAAAGEIQSLVQKDCIDRSH
jgi:D-alanyl-D-alanine carboxypeptidase